MRYHNVYGQERPSTGLTPKQGVGIALGILFITGWIFFRTLRPPTVGPWLTRITR